MTPAIEGVAVLFSGDPDTGKCSMDVFREGASETDPFHRAQALRDSCAPDFPERLWSIGLNDRARDLMRDARMRAMGFPVGRPRRILDLFCCEGGICAGYQRAGWEVYGLDMAPKFAKRYPGAGFACGDALAALQVLLDGGRLEFVARDGSTVWLGLADFDAIHASPPCQGYTRGNAGKVTSWPKLIPDVRALLDQTGLPYIIENVKDAGPEMVDPVLFCGCMFNLSVRDFTCTAATHEERIAHLTSGACNKRDGVVVHLERARLFETNWNLTAPRPCEGEGQGGYVPPDKALVQALLGVEHDMTWNGLFECVPPAFAEHIGNELLAHLDRCQVAS